MSHVSGRKEIPTINHGQLFIMNNFGSFMYCKQRRGVPFSTRQDSPKKCDLFLTVPN